MSISYAHEYDAFRHFGRMAALVAEEDRLATPEIGRIIGYVGRAASPKPTPLMVLCSFFKSPFKPLKPHANAA